MNKKLFVFLQYLVFLGGGIFLVWWQINSMSAEDKMEISNSFKGANYNLLLPIIIISILSHISRCMRWKLLMEPLEYNPALKNVFAATMVGYLVNTGIPRLGEIVKCTLLARYEKLKVDSLVGTILMERVFDLLCFMLFIIISVVIQFDRVSNFLLEELSILRSGLSGDSFAKPIAILICFGLIIFLVRYFIKRYPNNATIRKINNLLQGIGKGFSGIKKLKNIKAFLLHTIFIWAMYLLQVYIGFYAMEGTSHLDIKAACSVLSLATLAMIITPGGIGSFPLFVMKILMMYAVQKNIGLAFGWLIWTVNTGTILIVGFLALISLPYINRVKISKT